MPETDFAAFVNGHNRPIADPSFDRAGRLDLWTAALNRLHDLVREILRPYVLQGGIKLGVERIRLSEELLGQYQAPAMRIAIGNNLHIDLVPIGAMIFGASGRVDMRGPRAERRILLVPREVTRASLRVLTQEEMEREKQAPPPELVWKFSVGPRKDYVDVDTESLTRAIMELST